MRPPRLRTLLLGAILALSGVLNVVGLDFGQPRHYDQSVDSIHPAMSLDAVRHVFGTAKLAELKYPRTHLLAVGLVQRAYLLLRYGPAEARRLRDALLLAYDNAPRLVSADVRDTFRPFGPLIGELIVVGRSLSALAGVGVVLALFLLARSLFGFLSGALAAFFAAVSYPLVFYSHTLNVETPYLVFALFALYFGVRAVRTGRARWMLLAALGVAFSGAVKDQAFGLFICTLPLVLWLICRPGRLAGSGRRRFPVGAVLAAAVLSLGCYLLLLGLPFDVEGVRGHFEHIFGVGVTPYREAPNTLAGQWALLRLTGLHLLDGLGLPLLVLAVAGSIVMLVRSWRAGLLILVPAVTYYATFIAPIGYVYMRFTLPVMLLLLVAAADLCAGLLRVRSLKVPLALGLLLVLGMRMNLAVELDQLLVAEPRARASDYFEQTLPDGARVAVAAELPLHNLEFPERARVTYIYLPKPEETTFAFGMPEIFVASFFPRPRSIREPHPGPVPVFPSVPLLGRPFDLEVAIEPIRDHPIRFGAAFQPTVMVYRPRGE